MWYIAKIESIYSVKTNHKLATQLLYVLENSTIFQSRYPHAAALASCTEVHKTIKTTIWNDLKKYYAWMYIITVYFSVKSFYPHF